MTGSVNFDRAAGFYDETRGFPESVIERIGPFLADAAQLTGDETVLEVGIGTGRISLPLAPYVRRICGIDISPKMLQKLLDKRNDAAVFPTVGDAHYLPFADDSIDVVLVTHVFHLVDNPLAVLAEIRRVLKPGGCLLHTFGRYGYADAMQPISEAWRPYSEKSTRNARWSNTEDLASPNGWETVRTAEFAYDYDTCPAEFLECVEGRIWSSTWYIPEDDLQAGAAAIRAAVDVHFNGDPNTVVPTVRHYHAHIITPTDI